MNSGEAAQQRVFASYIRWVSRTSRIAVDMKHRSSAIAAIWSESVFCLLPAVLRRRNLAVFVFDDLGADWMVPLLDRLGITAIVVNHGGADGIRRARAWLAEPDRLLAITLDGPAGPRRVAKPGIVRLARMLRAPLLPVSISASMFTDTNGLDARFPYGHGKITIADLDPLPLDLPPADVAERFQGLLPEMLREETGHPGPIWRTISRTWVGACCAPLFTDRIIVGKGLKNVTAA